MQRRSLFAIKAAVLALLVAAFALAPHVPPRLGAAATAPSRALQLSYPQDWPGGWYSVALIMNESPRRPVWVRQGSTDAPNCTIRLMRVTWRDFETICLSAVERAPAPEWRLDDASVLTEVARYLGMAPQPMRVERVALDGRPALMMVAPRCGGWGAAVVAPGKDLALLHIFASSETRLREVWPTWRAIMRSTRLPGDDAVGSIAGDPDGV